MLSTAEPGLNPLFEGCKSNRENWETLHEEHDKLSQWCTALRAERWVFSSRVTLVGKYHSGTDLPRSLLLDVVVFTCLSFLPFPSARLNVPIVLDKARVRWPWELSKVSPISNRTLPSCAFDWPWFPPCLTTTPRRSFHRPGILSIFLFQQALRQIFESSKAVLQSKNLDSTPNSKLTKKTPPPANLSGSHREQSPTSPKLDSTLIATIHGNKGAIETIRGQITELRHDVDHMRTQITPRKRSTGSNFPQHQHVKPPPVPGRSSICSLL